MFSGPVSGLRRLHTWQIHNEIKPHMLLQKSLIKSDHAGQMGNHNPKVTSIAYQI